VRVPMAHPIMKSSLYKSFKPISFAIANTFERKSAIPAIEIAEFLIKVLLLPFDRKLLVSVILVILNEFYINWLKLN
jgi:hypothetical protein